MQTKFQSENLKKGRGHFEAALATRRCNPEDHIKVNVEEIQGDFKSLSGFLWPVIFKPETTK
jgi:hypothetical protein